MSQDLGTRDVIVMGDHPQRAVPTIEAMIAAPEVIEEIGTLDGVVTGGILRLKSAADVRGGGLLSQVAPIRALSS